MTARNLIVAASLSGTALAPAALPAGALPVADLAAQADIPARALEAYQTAATGPDACPGLDWAVIAGIYARESDHGRFGGATLDADGVARPAIYGVPVDWMGGARAEGPGQFMPSSWDLFGEGDPQDIDQAATATARHLCGTHGDLEGDHLRSAVVSYYGADQDGYADGVLSNIDVYRELAGAPVGDEAPASPGDVIEDGLTLRVADRLLFRTYEGWKQLVGWGTTNAPEAVPMLTAADGVLDRLVTPAGSDAFRQGTDTPAPATADGLVCPVAGASISSDWGDARDGGARTHQGIDLAHDEGTPIVAPFNARVVDTIDVEADGGLGGISLWLEATDGPHQGAAVYVAHNRRNLVRAGQSVAQGQPVAELGNTGVGTGPHAHISWAPDGGAFTDPAPIRNACQEISA